MSIEDRIEALVRKELPERALRSAILDVISAAVRFDSYVWLSTDPETTVGCLPLAAVPDLREVPSLIRLRYNAAENRWDDADTQTVRTLVGPTFAVPAKRSPWTDHLVALGVTDVMTTVLRDAYGCWGVIDLWRIGGAFTAAECAVLEACASAITAAVRRSLLPTFEGTFVPSVGVTSRADEGAMTGEPAVVLLDDDLTVLAQTPHAQVQLRSLLPAAPGHSPIPAAVYNVAAQLLANERGAGTQPPRARLPLAGLWLTTRAARAEGPSTRPPVIAVSIERATPAERTDMYARVAGLTAREGDILRVLVDGGDTREVAAQLFLSPHTVQDHLKSIFDKAGVRSRKALIARATG